MDASTFDRWTMSMATRPTRRAITQAIAGSALATVLPHFGGEDAAAKCVKLGKKCKTKRGKKKCCGGAKCQGKKCKCPEGQIDTGDQCVTGAGTCRFEDSIFCIDTCNNSPQCVCHLTYEGVVYATSEVRCGDNSIQSQCGECTTDVECAAYGPGSFCAIEQNINPGICGGCAANQGFCRTPCPN